MGSGVEGNVAGDFPESAIDANVFGESFDGARGAEELVAGVAAAVIHLTPTDHVLLDAVEDVPEVVAEVRHAAWLNHQFRGHGDLLRIVTPAKGDASLGDVVALLVGQVDGLPVLNGLLDLIGLGENRVSRVKHGVHRELVMAQTDGGKSGVGNHKPVGTGKAKDARTNLNAARPIVGVDEQRLDALAREGKLGLMGEAQKVLLESSPLRLADFDLVCGSQLPAVLVEGTDDLMSRDEAVLLRHSRMSGVGQDGGWCGRVHVYCRFGLCGEILGCRCRGRASFGPRCPCIG